MNFNSSGDKRVSFCAMAVFVEAGRIHEAILPLPYRDSLNCK